MPEISHKEFDSHLKTLNENDFSPIYLIFGEEMLFKDVFEALLSRLLPEKDRALCYEPFEGMGQSVSEAVSSVNTFSLTGGKKVVALKETSVFQSKKNEADILKKAKKAFDSGDLKKAEKPFLNVLGLCGFTLEDLAKKSVTKKLVSGSDTDDGRWLDAMATHCRENRLSPPEEKDQASLLIESMEKGFPVNHHLLITTEFVDRRKALFKAMVKHGMVINCSIPKGVRKQDKIEQEKALREASLSILSRSAKTLDPGAFHAICEMTGFDMRAFSNGLEKLVDYIGKRKKITRQDVEALLSKTKNEPVFEFTNALADRKLDMALYFMKSLIADGMHPLQLLSAAVNQMRRLLLAKEVVQDLGSSNWSRITPYNTFTRTTMPLVIDGDKRFKETVAKLREKANANSGAASKKVATDLVMAKNPKSPYPVYQTLLKSEKFTREELILALEKLSDADLKLKSTGTDPGLILEKALFDILV